MLNETESSLLHPFILRILNYTDKFRKIEGQQVRRKFEAFLQPSWSYEATYARKLASLAVEFLRNFKNCPLGLKFGPTFSLKRWKRNPLNSNMKFQKSFLPF